MLEGGKHVNISFVVINKKTSSFKDFYDYSAFFQDRVKKKIFFLFRLNDGCKVRGGVPVGSCVCVHRCFTCKAV